MDKQELPKELPVMWSNERKTKLYKSCSVYYQAALKQLEEARQNDFRNKIPDGKYCFVFEDWSIKCPFCHKCGDGGYYCPITCYDLHMPQDKKGVLKYTNQPYESWNCPKPPIEKELR